MNSLSRLVFAAMLILLPLSDALAKDVCVSNIPFPANGSGRIVFRNVKKLKAGTTIPLNGLWFDGLGNMGPIDGTATMTKDNVARFGVMVYRTGISGYSANYTATLIGDAKFNAAGTYDGNGDLQSDGFGYAWTNVDCKTLTIP